MPDSAGRIAATISRFGPHRVRITLEHDNVPSTTIEAAASEKKFTAVASWVDSHQPPSPINSSRALCASTGPTTLAAPCDEKYIELANPMKAYIGAAVDRYCWLAARTAGSGGQIVAQRAGKTAIKLPIRPTEINESRPAVQAIRRARAMRSAPIAIPIIGTEAIPTANETDVNMNSSRAPMP